VLGWAQVRVFNTEVLTGVDTPAQYCTKAYFKARAPSPGRRGPRLEVQSPCTCCANAGPTRVPCAGRDRRGAPRRRLLP